MTKEAKNKDRLTKLEGEVTRLLDRVAGLNDRVIALERQGTTVTDNA